jgi:hypothetical protein
MHEHLIIDKAQYLTEYLRVLIMIWELQGKIICIICLVAQLIFEES